MTYRFGPFLANRTTYRVHEGDRDLELTPKLLDLLFYFLDRPAALVTKEELLDGVWPGANVTDNALAQAISDLRDALGDSPSAPVYIRTVARRGYRFVSPVDAARPDAGTPAEPVPGASEAGAGVKRPDDTPSIDHAHPVERRQVIRHRLGDAGREPVFFRRCSGPGAACGFYPAFVVAMTAIGTREQP